MNRNLKEVPDPIFCWSKLLGNQRIKYPFITLIGIVFSTQLYLPKYDEVKTVTSYIYFSSTYGIPFVKQTALR